MEQVFLGRISVRSWPEPDRLLHNPAALLEPLAHAAGDTAAHLAYSAGGTAAAHLAHSAGDTAARLYQYARKGEALAHKRCFDEIVAALVPYSREYGEESIQVGRESAQGALDRGIMVCESREGKVFALDPQERWIALTVLDETSPREVADAIQKFLGRLVDNQDSRIEVDLVCEPGTILEELADLSSVAELEVTIRLPNDRGKSLYDAIRQMERMGATEKTDIFRSERGLWVSSDDAKVLDEEASLGNVDVRATSLNGAVFDSRENVAQFFPPFKVTAELVPLSLVMAILWLIQNWPPRGGGMS